MMLDHRTTQETIVSLYQLGGTVVRIERAVERLCCVLKRAEATSAWMPCQGFRRDDDYAGYDAECFCSSVRICVKIS